MMGRPSGVTTGAPHPAASSCSAPATTSARVNASCASASVPDRASLRQMGTLGPAAATSTNTTRSTTSSLNATSSSMWHRPGSRAARSQSTVSTRRPAARWASGGTPASATLGVRSSARASAACTSSSEAPAAGVRGGSCASWHAMRCCGRARISRCASARWGALLSPRLNAKAGRSLPLTFPRLTARFTSSTSSACSSLTT
mmetsp:Transcript_414/g.1235  ORF Transcript_414/g.1235 Transcript_414/m.1235 type:complete len:202 (+) Transcript_414:1626-2231(+)